jgi:hypothetical protein
MTGLQKLFRINSGSDLSLVDDATTAKTARIIQLNGLPTSPIQFAMGPDSIPIGSPPAGYESSRVAKYGAAMTARHMDALANASRVTLYGLPNGAAVLGTPNLFRVPAAVDPVTWVTEHKNVLAELRYEFATERFGSIATDGASYEDDVDRLAREYFGRLADALGGSLFGYYDNDLTIAEGAWAFGDEGLTAVWVNADTTICCYYVGGLPRNLASIRIQSTQNKVIVRFHDVAEPGLVLDETNLQVFATDLSTVYLPGASTVSFSGANTGKLAQNMVKLLDVLNIQELTTMSWPGSQPTAAGDLTNLKLLAAEQSMVGGVTVGLPLPYYWLVRPALAADFGFSVDMTEFDVETAQGEDVVQFTPLQLVVRSSTAALRSMYANYETELGLTFSTEALDALANYETGEEIIYTSAPVVEALQYQTETRAFRTMRRDMLDKGAPEATIDETLLSQQVWDPALLADPQTFANGIDDEFPLEVATLCPADATTDLGFYAALPAWLLVGMGSSANDITVTMDPVAETLTLSLDSDEDVFSEQIVLAFCYSRSCDISVSVSGGDAAVPSCVALWPDLLGDFEGTMVIQLPAYLEGLRLTDPVADEVLARNLDLHPGKRWNRSWPWLHGEVSLGPTDFRGDRDLIKRWYHYDVGAKLEMIGYGRLALHTMPKVQNV